MKKQFTIKMLLHFTIAVAIIWGGCKKNEDTNNQAIQYDNNNLGSYKGVLVGSSGYITIDLKPTGATATIVFDNITYQLSSTVAIPAGAKVTGYTLQKDAVKVVMDVNADGSIPQIAVTIPGHDVTAIIYKVTSFVAVESYTGTYRNTDSQSPQYNNAGVLSFAVSGDNVTLLSKCSSGDCDDNETDKMTGKIVRSGSNFTINFDNCAPTETICSLPFTKTATGYQAVVVIEEGIKLTVDLKKVQ